jgi:hypothetical protein
LPVYNQRGKDLGHGRRGALIYEGMRFSFQDDGRYEVSFVIDTPATPTVLDLQFLIHLDGNWHTVTLPPIRIEPEKSPQGKYEGKTDRIDHCGYSAAIERLWPLLRDIVPEIRRQGTARFGFGVPE